jgi:hypothetical protein
VLQFEAGRLVGKTLFYAFIDDAIRCMTLKLNKFSDYVPVAREVMEHLTFTLKVFSREMNWQKTAAHPHIFMMLSEIVVNGQFIPEPAKCITQASALERLEVADLGSIEDAIWGKAGGMLGRGVSEVFAYSWYVHECLIWIWRFGIRFEELKEIPRDCLIWWLLIPRGLGGFGMRTPMQLGTTEGAPLIEEGIAALQNIMVSMPQGETRTIFRDRLQAICDQPLEEISNKDWLRDCTQAHIDGPRIRSQRVAMLLQHKFENGTLVTNPSSKKLIEDYLESWKLTEPLVELLRQQDVVDKKNIEELYSISGLFEYDKIIAKIVKSNSVRHYLGTQEVLRLRRAVRRDAMESLLNVVMVLKSATSVPLA